MHYDIIIVGGGPSGLMAAIAASRGGANVLLVDKGDKLGRKLGISGGGRCNVTNNKDLDELMRNIPGNGRFLYSAMAAFNNRHIIEFFEGLGIRLKEEDNGRMFPASDKAKTVVDALVSQVRKQGVRILTNSPVQRVIYRDGAVRAIELKNGQTYEGTCIILAAGGKSVPQTGSTGDAYAWAEEAGHTITELFPTEVPITLTDAFIQSRGLQGLSLRDVKLSVWNPKQKLVIAHRGDMIFTHHGISGPIALRCSQFIHKVKKQFDVREVRMEVDLFPDESMEQLYMRLYDSVKAEHPKKVIRNTLKSFIPDRLIPVLLRKSEVDGDLTGDHISKQAMIAFAQTAKALSLHANGTLSIEQAFVTGGGVHLKEIDPRSMQSKIIQGLYFCGELLDIHGYTGGYNITAAFVTGYTAGTHAAMQVKLNSDG